MKMLVKPKGSRLAPSSKTVPGELYRLVSSAENRGTLKRERRNRDFGVG